MSETEFRGPEAIPFPTDRESLHLIVQAFVGLLNLRVQGGDDDDAGCDYLLPDGTPDGLSLDRVVCALLRHGEELQQWAIGGADEVDEMRDEIHKTIAALLD